jgi:membrane-associated phospholipid phosphatase
MMLYAERVYKLEWLTELMIIVPSEAIDLYSSYRQKNIMELSLEEIEELSRYDINVIDRFATSHYSNIASRVSDVLVAGCNIAPLAFMFRGQTRGNRWAIFVMQLETTSVTGSLTNLSKNSTLRPRPFVYNESVDMSKRQSVDARRSFFSGHTAMAFSGAILTAKMWSDFNPDKNSTPAYAMAVTAGSTVGALRVFAGRHYPTDVIAGALVGTGVALLITEVHKVSGSKADDGETVPLINIGVRF